MPKISVVIPTYNRRESVERVLESLVHQSLDPREYEVIISIDGSEDGTRELVESFKAPYELKCLWRPNSGRASALNNAMALVSSEIVIILDDDMKAPESFVEEHYKAHLKDPNLGVIGAAPIHIDPSSTFTARYIADEFNSRLIKVSAPDYDFQLWDFYAGNFSIRRDTFLRAGGFNQSFNLYGYEDIELAYRLIKSGTRIVYSPEATCTQYYDNDFKKLASNTISGGKMTVLMVSMHPELFEEIKLREYNHAGWKLRALRVSLIKLSLLIPKTNAIIISLVKLLEKRRSKKLWKAYSLSMDYFFWFGVFSEIKENGNYSLLSKIKSCRWLPK